MTLRPHEQEAPPTWERRNVILLTLAFAGCYGLFSALALDHGSVLRGRLAAGAAGLHLGLTVLAWQGLPLRWLYLLILSVITGVIWLSMVVFVQAGQPVPASALSTCGFVTVLAFTWYPWRAAVAWMLAACLPMLVAGLWVSFADVPTLVLGGMLLLLVMYMSRYSRHLLQAQDERQRLEGLALRDPLTGLYNRRLPLNELAAARQQSQAAAVVLLDLDHFKRFNDTYGHTHGDELLVAVAQRLTQALPAGTVLARWGGEEFLAILYGLDQVAARGTVAAALRQISASTDLNGLTLSAGGAMLTEAQTVPDLLALADRRLYAAKAAGRNQAYWA